MLVAYSVNNNKIHLSILGGRFMISKKTKYFIQNEKEFVIENYNWSKTFANFLPCIAGKTGKPMWVYYINRNQGICSMGVNNKDHQILDFLSFNKAIQIIGSQGFRTFIKINNETVYEPFCKTEEEEVEQKMVVTSEALQIYDKNNKLGIETIVKYFLLVKDEIPGIIRKVQINNLNNDNRKIDVIDGLPRIIPYGTDRDCINVTARHIEGLMQAYNVEDIPLYKLKINPADKPEIEILNGGNFYVSFINNLKHKKYIIDPALVFGTPENFDIPYNFIKNNFNDLLNRKQIDKNRTPSAFTALDGSTENEIKFYSLIGYADTDLRLKNILKKINCDSDSYFAKKEEQNESVIESIKNEMLTVSALNNFDQYCGQTYLDNVLRGGMPAVFETDTGKSVFYLYSRQNGDLERDYHDFVLEPTYYSQGNSHYRCVVQNRRSDNFFRPAINDYNMRFFLNMMQLDGYNPIEIRSTKYLLKNEEGFNLWLDKCISDASLKNQLNKYIKEPVTPGDILEFLTKETCKSAEENVELLEQIMSFCKENIVVDLHPRLGFWIDQWSYNLDLILSYLHIFPEKVHEVFLSNNYSFFDNCDWILPRNKKHILINGKVRQYESVERSQEKLSIINSRSSNPNTVRKDFGKGEIYETNLIVKLLTLIANRIATLDPENLGLEMEANKPGWNDSINGLPGILGSSLCHSFQLERFCNFLKSTLQKYFKQDETINIFSELSEYMQNLEPVMKKCIDSSDDNKTFVYWDESHSLKESYREKIRFGISGKEEIVSLNKIIDYLDICLDILKGIRSEENRTKVFNKDGIPYTYFINDVIDFSETGENDVNGNSFVKAKKFEQRPVSLFLEGPVHFFKTHPNESKKVYDAIKKSNMYDDKLFSYKSCESLENDTFEIGRIKAWGRGWLENESVYTHMLFKYLLEIINSGLYDEFFDDMKKILMPFLDPNVYGRSIFENVSFIVSSAFVDDTMHGQGFQARLSGSTCEMIQIWTIMCVGKKFFYLDEQNKLKLAFEPVLPEWLFTKENKEIDLYANEKFIEKITIPANCFAFKLFSKTLVIYHNPERKNTFGPQASEINSYEIKNNDASVKKIASKIIDTETALDIRNGKVKIINVFLS
jgi:hypothetical protein